MGLLIMKRCEFLGLGNLKKEVGTTATLDSQRTDFGLLRGLGERVPWETALKGRRVHKIWTLFKKEIL